MVRCLLFIVILTLNRADVPGGGLRGTPPRKWGTVKNHFPEGYCPRREKVLDLSRAVMTGNRRHARGRRVDGRYRHKADRLRSRTVLLGVTKRVCTCLSDPEFTCLRCFADDMPTVSETLGPYEWMGRADDLAQLIRWWDEVSKDMDSREALDTLRRRFLSTPFGNSLKTRHAYDHLVEGVRWDYGLEWKER